MGSSFNFSNSLFYFLVFDSKMLAGAAENRFASICVCVCVCVYALGSAQERGGQVKKKEYFWQYTHIL